MHTVGAVESRLAERTVRNPCTWSLVSQTGPESLGGCYQCRGNGRGMGPQAPAPLKALSTIPALHQGLSTLRMCLLTCPGASAIPTEGPPPLIAPQKLRVGGCASSWPCGQAGLGAVVCQWV